VQPKNIQVGSNLKKHNCSTGVVYMVPVGYTMRDIRYKWNEGPNSVGVSNEVSLPQFKVLGHRQRAMEISLTTGTYITLSHGHGNISTRNFDNLRLFYLRIMFSSH